ALTLTTIVLASLPPAPARAASRVHTVTIGTLVGESKPETQVWHFIRDKIESRLPGHFAFRIVPNAALGVGEKELVEGMQLGSVSGAVTTISPLSSFSPAAQILDLPFLLKDGAHLQRVLDGPLGDELKRDLEAKGFIVLGYVNYGVRYLFSKEAITSPEQLAGKRVRSIPNRVHTKMWQAFNAQPVTLPIAETYNALSTGVVEAMDLNKSAYAALKLYEVVPYLNETAHIWASGAIHVSSEFWKRLDQEEQKVFAQAALEGAAHFNELIVKDEALAVAEAAKAGGHVVKIPDRSPWERAAQKVWEEFAPQLGGLERIRAIHVSEDR
ncbi:MAG: TRAP transporter substrate-binding protein, partial [Candidatus Accumulibacter sp.]|nr:TRAP transporter substrate-binding protein [Accumulibacter sp.]